MIKETKTVIEFIPFNNKSAQENIRNDFPTISVSIKFGKISIGKHSIEKLNIKDKWIKLYFQPTQKIIGWKVQDIVKQEEMKDWTLVKVNTVGMFGVGIKKLLRGFQGLTKESYPNLEVCKYVDRRTTGYLEENSTYYYVKIK